MRAWLSLSTRIRFATASSTMLNVSSITSYVVNLSPHLRHSRLRLSVPLRLLARESTTNVFPPQPQYLKSFDFDTLLLGIVLLYYLSFYVNRFSGRQ